MRLAWGAKVSPEFRSRVLRIAERAGCDPSWLMACMAFETGRTFSPSVKNPGSSATGLIQFMAATAVGLNTTVEKLAAMSAVEQLDFVGRYFQPFAGRIKSLSDCYMAILWPAAVGRSEDAVIFHPGSKAYLANKGLDINHDGAVTKAEASQFVVKALAEGMQAANVFEMGAVPPKDLPTAPPVPTTSPKENHMGIAIPLLAQLIPQVLALFTKRAQATIAEKTGADPDIAAQFMQSLVEKVGQAVNVTVTDNATAIQAVAAITSPANAGKVVDLEEDALAWLDKMGPMLDRLQAAEVAQWAANDASADRASARAQVDKVDLAPTLVAQSAWAFLVAAAAVIGLMGYQMFLSGDGDIDGAMYGLLSLLVYGVVRMMDRPSAYRFGGAFESTTVESGKAVIDETIRRQTTKG